MDTELTRRLVEAAGPPPVLSDMAHVHRRAVELRRRRRRRRRAGLAATVAGMVAAAVVWWAPGVTPSSKLQVVSPPSSVASARGGGWATRVVSLGAPVEHLAVEGDALYGLMSTQADSQAPPGSGFVVFRYDLLRGRLTKGPTLPGLDDLAVAAASLWAVSGSRGGSPAHLYRIDPASLAVQHTWTLDARSLLVPGGAVASTVAATPRGLLWVGAGSNLYAIDPATNQVAAQHSLGGDITSMSAGPAGRLLYLAEQSTAVALSVHEVDAATAAPIRQRNLPGAIAGGGVTATSGGVWVTYRTGMAGGGVRLDANTLQSTAPTAVTLGTPFRQIGGIAISISDHVAWVTSRAGLACTDPATGAVRATTNIQTGPPVAANGTLYAATQTGLAIIGPPKTCFD